MKYAWFFCALILILALLPLQVHGVEMDTKNSKTIIFDDGSFIIVTLCEQVSRAGNEKTYPRPTHTTTLSVLNCGLPHYIPPLPLTTPSTGPSHPAFPMIFRIPAGM